MIKKGLIFIILTTLIYSNEPLKLKAKVLKEQNDLIINISKIEEEKVIKKIENNHIIYLIKKGDTLSEIAYKYKKKIKSIAMDNNIKNIDLIITGETLILK